MSKGSRTTQERLRRVQEEQRLRARRQARKRRMAIAGGTVVAVLAAVAVMVVVKVVVGDGSPKKSPQAAASGETAKVVAAITKVPADVLDKIGKGKATTLPTAIEDQPGLTADGKPLVLYVGAEYCPYCAAQRWAAVVALSRFGTFSGLSLTRSASAPEVFPDTPTVTFHGSSYTSQYLTFQGVETSSNVPQGKGYAPLDKLTPEQNKIVQTINAPPYVPEDSAGAIPFLDLGNKYFIVGSSFDPEVLKGKSAQQIADALARPDDPIAKAVDGAANSLTATICKITNNQPGEVCNSAAATAYAGKL